MIPGYERFRDYLLQPRRIARPDSVTRRYADQEVMTGQPLVDRIVRAIELNQSVLLAGPRGCGKSWCIDKAISQAMERGVIPPKARVFLQGNKEIPRDYLAEDQIAFKVQQQDGREEVVPVVRSAPLFRFAQRQPGTQLPVTDDADRVLLEPAVDSDPDGVAPRFVLFLDEINRFSDGLLDSLLSVLEERKAVLAGKEYGIPVVVCMTMNPPGYDASARRLSPPLAARINRSLTLKSPDLDTLHDIIVERRLSDLRSEHENNRRRVKPGVFFPFFPEVSPRTIRLACVVTLALWGDVEEDEPSFEYLTRATHALLARLKATDGRLAEHMRWISRLCRFGPDGRAAADWVTSALGLAIDEAIHLKDPHPTLSELHFLATARDTLAHKIYDDFSAASQPAKARQKVESVQAIVEQVFKRRAIWDLVRRFVDEPHASIWQNIQRQAPVAGDTGTLIATLRRCRVTEGSEIERLPEVLATLSQAGSGSQVEAAMTAAGFIEESRDGSQKVFSDPRYKALFEDLAADASNRLDAAARELLMGYGQQQIRLEDRLRQHEVVADMIGAEAVLRFKKELQATVPDVEEVLVMLEEIWSERPSIHGPEPAAEPPEAPTGLPDQLANDGWSFQRATLLRRCLQRLEDRCQEEYLARGGRQGMFLVRLLDRLLRRQIPVEARRWQQDRSFCRQLRKSLSTGH